MPIGQDKTIFLTRAQIKVLLMLIAGEVRVHNNKSLNKELQKIKQKLKD